MLSWPYWTPWATRCPSARRPSAEGSPTPPTKRRLSSRWLFSSCRTSRSSSPSTTSAAWSARRWSAGFRSVSTAPGRRSSPTGLRWRSLRDSRSATGTVCWSPSGPETSEGERRRPRREPGGSGGEGKDAPRSFGHYWQPSIRNVILFSCLLMNFWFLSMFFYFYVTTWLSLFQGVRFPDEAVESIIIWSFCLSTPPAQTTDLSIVLILLDRFTKSNTGTLFLGFFCNFFNKFTLWI